MIIKLGRRILSETDKRLLLKFLFNFGWKGIRAVRRFRKRVRQGEFFPAFLFLSVTDKCNLNCQGCWITAVKTVHELDLETMESIISQSKQQGFCARLLTIEAPELDIFRDRSVPKGSPPKEKKFPQQLLRELTFKLGIDEIKISKGNIVFSVSTVIRKKRKSGKIFFTGINSTIKNVTNDTGLLKTKPSIEVNTEAKLMGKGILNASLSSIGI